MIFAICILLLTACNPATPSAAPLPSPTAERKPPPTATLSPTRQSTPTERATLTQAAGEPEPSETQEPSQTPTRSPSSTPTETLRPTLAESEWKELPVVPEISQAVVQIYQYGLELGRNPLAFSKIGDCGSTPAWFLGDFDRGPDFYSLGEYDELEAVIQAFQGSFGRTSLAARSGFNASSLFVPLWADRSQCQSNETPLACEYRDQRPAIAFIMLGANDVWHPEEFEPQMRKIIEYSLENGVVPILSTKADDQEGNHSLNATIARLAWEYELPLWNFWLAVQELPDQGLQEDKVHLTWGRNFFDDPNAMNKAWPVRNLTALQVLDAIWRAVGAPGQ